MTTSMQLLHEARLNIFGKRFPGSRPFEALFYPIPLGAQYYVAARKPPHPSASRIL